MLALILQFYMDMKAIVVEMNELYPRLIAQNISELWLVIINVGLKELIKQCLYTKVYLFQLQAN